MADLFKELLKEADSDYGDIIENMEDCNSFISTGSYSLNALLSGSIYGGLPGNQITAFAGQAATGKTYYVLNIICQFLKDNPDGFVFLFESEHSVTKAQLESRNVDQRRLAKLPVETVEEFRTQATRIINKYLEKPEKERKPMLFALDSLGMLSTAKEVTDIAEGKGTRDMTRAQLIRGAFRTLTLKLGKANVPMIITNHTYDVIGSYVPTQKMSGGSGVDYAASTIIFLTKKKDKDESTKEILGVIITGKTQKGRLTKENQKVETLLNYDTGLDPYYGLLELAVDGDIIKKGTAGKYIFPDGTEAKERDINKKPEKFFTKDILDKIDTYCLQVFRYGGVIKKREEIGEKDEK